MPLIAQLEILGLDFNELITLVGVFGFVVIILGIIAYLLVRAVTTGWRNESQQQLAQTQADLENQRTLTNMVPSLSEQLGRMQLRINEQSNKILEMTEQRTKDREQYLELKAQYESSSIKITHLQSEVKTLERQVAQLQVDNKIIRQDRDRYRSERDKLAKLIDKQRTTIIQLEAQNKVMYSNLQLLMNKQRIAPTKEIPDAVLDELSALPDLVDLDDTDIPLTDEDGNLITPIVNMMTADNANVQPLDTAHEDNLDDSNESDIKDDAA